MLRMQRGSALIVSLMILLVMSIIGISAMNTTTMEEKMASNTSQRQLAYQAAQTALRDAENWLTDNILTVADLTTNFTTSTPGRFPVRPTVVGAATASPSFSVYSDSAMTTNGYTSFNLVAGQPLPVYIIEYIGRVGPPPLDYTEPDVRKYGFRITAVGWGADQVARYLAWSNYQRQLN